MRSLSIVSLAQRMITLSRSCTNASSALAAFYTRHFAEKVPDIKPPSLQEMNLFGSVCTIVFVCVSICFMII
jgi:hypothetical protein